MTKHHRMIRIGDKKMVKYKIEHRRHYVYSYADHTWHDFDDRDKAFDFMREEIGA